MQSEDNIKKDKKWICKQYQDKKCFTNGCYHATEHDEQAPCAIGFYCYAVHRQVRCVEVK